MSKPRKVAILTADWHLWSKPPVARSNEPDWLLTQNRYLHQIQKLSSNYFQSTWNENIPVIMAGDVFDKYNPSPEVLNIALSYMPKVYAVPGNHDLPNHRLDDVEKSGFWTLVKAGKVIPIFDNEGFPVEIGNLRLHAFPYGTPIRPLEDPHDLYQEIAVCHEFVYTDKTGYPNAPIEQHLNNFRKRARGYDVVVVGDNHVPFMATKHRPIVINCGSLTRRTIDQKDYKPRVWWLYSDNTVEPHYLDTSKDAPMVDVRDYSDVKIDGVRLKKFMEELKTRQVATIGFEETLKRYLREHKVEEAVKNYILAAIEEEDAR